MSAELKEAMQVGRFQDWRETGNRAAVWDFPCGKVLKMKSWHLRHNLTSQLWFMFGLVFYDLQPFHCIFIVTLGNQKGRCHPPHLLKREWGPKVIEGLAKVTVQPGAQGNRCVLGHQRTPPNPGSRPTQQFTAFKNLNFLDTEINIFTWPTFPYHCDFFHH